ncbi:MAG: hypothetical protein Q9191_003650 [Dirinaria sp. TL-2023a]
MDMVLLTRASDINEIFGQSKNLTNKIYREFVSNTFGVPSSFKRFFAADDSGLGREPRAGSKIKLDHRVDYLMHSLITQFLSGPDLAPLATRFSNNISQRLEQLEVTQEWSDVPDLYAFVQEHVFHASVEAIFGSSIFELNPEFSKDFAKFEAHVPELAKGYPRFLNRGAYKARDRCIAGVKKWQSFLNDQKRTGTVPCNDYDPQFGSRLVQRRHSAFAKMEPMNADARASEDLALIWGSSSNAIHAAFWLIYEVFRSPSVLDQFRDTISLARCGALDEESISPFDLTTLCASPFLQSLYAETLRLRVANIILRTPTHEDMRLRNWLLPQGSVVAAMSFLAHRDERVYSVGSEDDPHPLDEFWTERFLQTQQKSGKCATHQTETIPHFSLHGLAGAWIPYGGGSFMCPGRHFAKQEILLTAALLALNFDISLERPLPEVDMRYFGTGTLGVKGRAKCRIRRRLP